jgi:hypothetical protein
MFLIRFQLSLINVKHQYELFINSSSLYYTFTANNMEDRQYLTTWKRYLPVIRLHIKKSFNEDQQFKLNIQDFESAGDRGKSGYTFNIQLENGKVTNNISGSAVARDLFEALKSDDAIKAMLLDKSVKISVGKSFMLTIKTTHISAYK